MSLIKRLTARNVGTTDRIVRTLPALLIVYFWFIEALSGTALIVSAIIALMLLLTAITSRCSIYAMFGIRTCSTDNQT